VETIAFVIPMCAPRAEESHQSKHRVIPMSRFARGIPRASANVNQGNNLCHNALVAQPGIHNYFVYILTNQYRDVLYVGVTNDIRKRLQQHIDDAQTTRQHFSGRYNCVFLIYYELFQHIDAAINRETEIKAWRREKKDRLINSVNPEWKFLNDELW
jgi:putative endonuclease